MFKVCSGKERRSFESMGKKANKEVHNLYVTPCRLEKKLFNQRRLGKKNTSESSEMFCHSSSNNRLLLPIKRAILKQKQGLTIFFGALNAPNRELHYMQI